MKHHETSSATEHVCVLKAGTLGGYIPVNSIIFLFSHCSFMADATCHVPFFPSNFCHVWLPGNGAAAAA